MEITQLSNPELTFLINNKQSGYNYQERRYDDWNENYTLYRDKVITNRLIQRQTVNIPLMKQTIRTLLKDVDDMPVLYYENLDNNKQAELFKNEYWQYTVEQNNMELQDIVDKRQVFLFGRSFDQWQIMDGKVKMEVQDPMDIYVDRYCDPTNINTSRFLIHTHIFKPLSVIERNPDYDRDSINRLKMWYMTDAGEIKLKDNQSSLEDKKKKMVDMGLTDVDNPVVGEMIVELSLHFVYRKEGDEDEQIWLYVEADDTEILMKKRLEDVIDPNRNCKDHFWQNHYPYNTWADDVERQDFWSDGIGDIVRQPNKVLNAWFSQLVENRTLRNFSMHYYDSTIEGFTPGTYNPVAWGWYGVPGKPSDVLSVVDIPDLSDSLNEMEFVLTMMEKATGATATQEGVQTQNQVTLGEVQLMLGEAKERIKGMSKFYTPAWKHRGEMFIKLVEAGADKLDAVKIYKKGKNSSDLFGKEISPDDWQTPLGYQVKVWSQEDRNTQDTNDIQKLNAVMVNMPGNQKLVEIYQRKLLEFADLTPQEINDVMAQEKQKLEALTNTGVNPMMGAVPGQVPPGQTPPTMAKPPTVPNRQPAVQTQ
jgi:hypothetical protein